MFVIKLSIALTGLTGCWSAVSRTGGLDITEKVSSLCWSTRFCMYHQPNDEVNSFHSVIQHAIFMAVGVSYRLSFICVHLLCCFCVIVRVFCTVFVLFCLLYGACLLCSVALIYCAVAGIRLRCKFRNTAGWFNFFIRFRLMTRTEKRIAMEGKFLTSHHCWYESGPLLLLVHIVSLSAS